MKLKITYTTKFQKELKLVIKQKRNIEKLLYVIDCIANQEQLDPKYKDHPLKGKYVNCRECHIENDFLLIYRIHADYMELVLLRLGSHSKLFG